MSGGAGPGFAPPVTGTRQGALPARSPELPPNFTDRLANPQWGNDPATGIGAGKTWAYTDDQGQLFADNPAAPHNLPRVRTLANGLMGMVDSGTARSPGFAAFNMGGTDQIADDPLFSSFTNPKGSKTRQVTSKDVSRKEIERRASERFRAADAARIAQNEKEAASPRLNDLTRAGYLYGLTKSGRNPLSDAMAQRRAMAMRMGL